MTDYYQALGVGRQADEAEIKRAYRKLAKKYHPDIVGDDPAARKRFEDITKAYEVLGDEQSRKVYDQKQKQQQGPRQPFQKQQQTSGYKPPGPEDFSGIFGKYFGFQPEGQNQQQDAEAFQTDDLFRAFFNPKKKNG